jgi:DNA-binding NarL/FixJ family response regulator
VLLDVAMPVMDGAECFNQLQALDSQVRVLITSGYAQDGVVQGLLDRGAVAFVPKPFDGRQLSEAVAAGIGA